MINKFKFKYKLLGMVISEHSDDIKPYIVLDFFHYTWLFNGPILIIQILHVICRTSSVFNSKSICKCHVMDRKSNEQILKLGKMSIDRCNYFKVVTKM